VVNQRRHVRLRHACARVREPNVNTRMHTARSFANTSVSFCVTASRYSLYSPPSFAGSSLMN
jgi:hypothetical protein